MSARKTTTSPAKTPEIKFEKQAWYEDHQGHVLECANGRPHKTPDGHMAVLMRAVTNGQPTGEPGEEYVDTIVKKLTKAEITELQAVGQRETEALKAAQEGVETAEPAKATRKGKAQPPAEPKTAGRLSALEAAARVLGESAEPLSTQQLIAAMAEKGYWTSPGGKTPAATLYSALLREIQTKGDAARFQKTDRGRFALREAPVAAPVEATTPSGKKKRKMTLPADGSPGPKSVADLFKF